jgi:hypothetical protein
MLGIDSLSNDFARTKKFGRIDRIQMDSIRSPVSQHRPYIRFAAQSTKTPGIIDQNAENKYKIAFEEKHCEEPQRARHRAIECALSAARVQRFWLVWRVRHGRASHHLGGDTKRWRAALSDRVK